jgi:hypothetical protein
MTARELEAALIKAYGPDFRDKAIVGPLGSFRLADSFAECGLTDPQEPSSGYGLWQMAPSRWPPG